MTAVRYLPVLTDMKHPAEPYTDKRTTARMMCVSVRTLENWLAEGCPSLLCVGKRVFVFSEVREWAEKRGHLVKGSAA